MYETMYVYVYTSRTSKHVSTLAHCFRIGYAIAERLAQEGARVVLSSRKQVNVDRAVAELTSKGYHVTGCVCHVANKDHRQQLYRLV